MSVYVHADSGELWDFFVTINNIQEMADNECDDICRELNILIERMENEIKRSECNVDNKKSEIASEKYKEEPNNGHIQQLMEEVNKLEIYIEELQECRKKAAKYLGKIEDGKKTYKNSFRVGKRYVNKYLQILESVIYGQIGNVTLGRETKTDSRSSATLEEGSKSLYHTMDFRGVTFYCNDSEIDLKGKDAKGRSNMRRMERGLAPIGRDGLPMNLHHMLQSEQKGSMVELSESRHKKSHKILHINDNGIPSSINRGTFSVLRKAYWKMRAKTFK